MNNDQAQGLDPKDIDEYIARFPENVGAILRKVRSTIATAAPAAAETISYQMPTFTLNGRHLIHFGAYKKHIGLYPVATTHPELEEALRPYAAGKGSARFPLNEPLPYGLITKVVELKVRESAQRLATGNPGSRDVADGAAGSETSAVTDGERG